MKVLKTAIIVGLCGLIIFLLFSISRNGRYRIVIGDITETDSSNAVTASGVVSKCFLLDSSTGRVFVYVHDHWETIEGKQVSSVGFYPVDITEIK